MITTTFRERLGKWTQGFPRWIVISFSMLLVMGIFFLGQTNGFFERLELLTYDYRSKLAFKLKPAISDRVALVTLDRNLIKNSNLEKNPWLAEILKAQNGSVVASLPGP